MNAVEWIRSRAQVSAIETMVISESEGADIGATPGTYKITRSVFRGQLPARMVFDARKHLSSLVSSDNEVETLSLGGQYRSDFGKCEYIHATYERVA